MAEGRKRRGPIGLSSTSQLRRRQRERHDDRDQLQRTKAVSALTAAVLMVSVVASVVAHSHTPHARRLIYEPRRLPWDEHEADLEERDCFRRYYRMDMQSFHKLAELLRPPLLEVNVHYADSARAEGRSIVGEPREC